MSRDAWGDGLGDWGLCSDWVMTRTRDIGVLGLLNTTAAYWRGDDGSESVMMDLSTCHGFASGDRRFGVWWFGICCILLPVLFACKYLLASWTYSSSSTYVDQRDTNFGRAG